MLIKKVANVLGLSDCPASHPDLNAGLCYKRCKENYSGAATVCWSNCPESTINLGGSCVGNVKEGFMKDRGPGKAVDLTANNNNPCTENKDCLKREYHAGFCYEKCADDETRVVDRCYKNCPNTEPGKQDLYRNDGLFCGKKSYGNGWGYVEKGKCEEENKGKGCFKCLALYYPNCDEGMISGMEHGTGCNICRTKDCPPGFVDIGVSCTKPSYSTGVGQLPDKCEEDRVFEDLMCYRDCNKIPEFVASGNTTGTGVFCRKSCGDGKFDGTGCTRDSYDRGVGKLSPAGVIKLIITIIIIIIILVIIFKVVVAAKKGK